MSNDVIADWIIGIDLKCLIGKIIKNITISKESEQITFETDAKYYIYNAYADVRGSSWIEFIDGIKYLIDQKIVKIDKKYTSREGANEHQYLNIMNYEIHTEKGICTIGFCIGFRNASWREVNAGTACATKNGYGYYGGFLELVSVKSKDKPDE